MCACGRLSPFNAVMMGLKLEVGPGSTERSWYTQSIYLKSNFLIQDKHNQENIEEGDSESSS